MTSIKTPCFLTLVFFSLVVFSPSARAGFVRSNGSLDRILASKDLYQIFVARIASIKIYDDFPSQTHRVALRVVVGTVVFGPDLKIDQEIEYDDAFAWPENLVPALSGQRFILFTDKQGEKTKPRVAQVLPVFSAHIEAVLKASEARVLLMKELLSELKSETGPVRQRLLVRLVTPILEGKNADALLPFLDSKDEWLRRSVLAALVIVGRENKYSEMAAEDLRQFFRAHSKDTVIAVFSDWDNRSCNFSPYPLLFNYYYYLNTNPCPREEVSELSKFLLPLYRVVATDLKDSPDDCLFHGIGPLHHFGTREDVSFLYELHNHPDPHTRASSMAAISKILKLGITYTNDEDFLRQEPVWQEKVKQAIRSNSENQNIK